MLNYIIPKPKPFHLKDSPHDWWNEFLAELRHAEQQNHDMRTRMMNDYKELLRYAAIVYGLNSTEYKYLQKHPPEYEPNFKRLKTKMRMQWEAFLEKEQAKRYYKSYRERQKEATMRLEDRGYIAGEDFVVSQAISFEKRLNGEEIMRIEQYRQYEG